MIDVYTVCVKLFSYYHKIVEKLKRASKLSILETLYCIQFPQFATAIAVSVKVHFCRSAVDRVTSETNPTEVIGGAGVSPRII